MKKFVTCLLTSALFSTCAIAAQSPNCGGVEQWPANMAFVKLKNAGLITSESLDLSKTRVTRLASEQIKPNLFVQIHQISFTEKSGKLINVITNNRASSEECSMSDVEVFVIDTSLEAPRASMQ